MKKNHVTMERLPQSRINRSKVIALMNNKGGCGKTSTCIALGMYLVRIGHNVLFWDNDPQSNLTQRLGLPDDKCLDKRINLLFKEADMPGFENNQKKIASIVEYPYIYKLKDSIASPGKVGLMAGSPYAENEANNANSKLVKATFSRIEHKDIFKFFDSNVRFYCNYFDYVIIDTAPSLEGNILNRLAVRTADEIITPVDSIDAALGMRNLLSWIAGENTNGNANKRYPNMTFAMVKYHTDINKLAPNPDLRMRNSVFRSMKNAFGNYVCDNGVRESSTLRRAVAGFRGSKTDYYALSEEIVNKIENPRENIFAKLILPDILKELECEILNLQIKAQKEKQPTFKTPYYHEQKGLN